MKSFSLLAAILVVQTATWSESTASAADQTGAEKTKRVVKATVVGKVTGENPDKIGNIEVTYADGTKVTFQIAGLLSNSVLQGSLLVGEADFQRLFPQTSGYRSFLIRAPAGGENKATTADIAAALEDRLSDEGFDAVDAKSRLADLTAFSISVSLMFGSTPTGGSWSALPSESNVNSNCPSAPRVSRPTRSVIRSPSRMIEFMGRFGATGLPVV